MDKKEYQIRVDDCDEHLQVYWVTPEGESKLGNLWKETGPLVRKSMRSKQWVESTVYRGQRNGERGPVGSVLDGISYLIRRSSAESEETEKDVRLLRDFLHRMKASQKVLGQYGAGQVGDQIQPVVDALERLFPEQPQEPLDDE